MKALPVSEREHSRAWLMKIRLKAQDLNEVVKQALDALAEKEGWDDLKEDYLRPKPSQERSRRATRRRGQ